MLARMLFAAGISLIVAGYFVSGGSLVDLCSRHSSSNQSSPQSSGDKITTGNPTASDRPDTAANSSPPVDSSEDNPAPADLAPVIVCDAPLHNWSQLVSGEQSVIRHEFVVRNASTETPVRIVNHAASCNCTSAELSSEVVPAAGQITVTMTVDLVGKRTDQSVAVTLNPEQGPPLRLFLVIPMIDNLTVSPSPLALRQHRSGEGPFVGSATVTVASRETAGLFTPQPADMPEPLQLKLVPVGAPEFKDSIHRQKYSANFSVDPAAVTGQVSWPVRFVESAAETMTATLHITAAPPGIDCSPTVIAMLETADGKPGEQSVLLSSRDGAPFSIIAVEPSESCVSVDVSKTVPRSAHKAAVKVRFPDRKDVSPGIARQPLKIAFRVQSETLGEKVIEVPVLVVKASGG